MITNGIKGLKIMTEDKMNLEEFSLMIQNLTGR